MMLRRVGYSLTLSLGLALSCWASVPEGAAEAESEFLATPLDDGIEGVEPAGPPPANVDEVARRIAMGLRCPVCQGLSAGDSTSPAAVNMQRRVRELVAQGYSQQQIEDWFITRYGEWVLLSPRNQGFNQIVWLGPAGALVLGLGIALAVVGRRRSSATGAPAAPPPSEPDDPYARALLAEAEEPRT